MTSNNNVLTSTIAFLQVNDIACLNSTSSHLVLGVTSNRSVEIIDAAVGKFVSAPPH